MKSSKKTRNIEHFEQSRAIKYSNFHLRRTTTARTPQLQKIKKPKDWRSSGIYLYVNLDQALITEIRLQTILSLFQILTSSALIGVMTLMGAYEFSVKKSISSSTGWHYGQKVWRNLAETTSPTTPLGIVLRYRRQCLPSTDRQRCKRLRHAELPLKLQVGHHASQTAGF